MLKLKKYRLTQRWKEKLINWNRDPRTNKKDEILGPNQGRRKGKNDPRFDRTALAWKFETSDHKWWNSNGLVRDVSGHWIPDFNLLRFFCNRNVEFWTYCFEIQVIPGSLIQNLILILDCRNIEYWTCSFGFHVVLGILILSLLWIFCNKSRNVKNVLIFVRFFEWAYDISYHFEFFVIRWFFFQIIFADLWNQILVICVRFCAISSIFPKTVCRPVPVDQISSPSHQITIMSSRAAQRRGRSCRTSCRDYRKNE